MKEARIEIFGSIDEKLFHKTIGEINNRKKEGVERLHLLISSAGGSAELAITIYEYLRRFSDIEIFSYNVFDIQSAATLIYCCGQKRFSVPEAKFMFHLAATKHSPNLTAIRLKLIAENLNIVDKKMARIISDTTGKDINVVESDLENETLLSSGQAVEYGLVHAIEKDYPFIKSLK